jgi:hypothetical protein
MPDHACRFLHFCSLATGRNIGLPLNIENKQIGHLLTDRMCCSDICCKFIILLSLFIWYSSGVIEYQIKYALPYRAVARILFLAADFV